MWGSPEDPGGPGGPSKAPPSNQELMELKDQSEQQQVLIAQLKEMLRKTEQNTISKEKVDEYANTLSRINARVKKSKGSKDRTTDAIPRKTIDFPQRDKLNLLTQQMEAHKAMLAEREKNQKGIEEMVTQIKAQFDDPQQFSQFSTQPVLTLKSLENYSSESSSEELYSLLVHKEKQIVDLNNKVQKLEANVLDLQENLKEKDSVIDARTKAITLMSENLSKKGKTTLDALDDTKEQMRKMQENFVAFETQMKVEKQRLHIDLEERNNELFIMQSNNDRLSKEIESLQGKLMNVADEDSNRNLEESLKTTLSMNEERANEIERLTEKIQELNSTITELQSRDAVGDGRDEEMLKLKKQLEESNKNMIKAKAQHKGKIKELTKKIDNFKKISDTNAEIVKLETENARLTAKITELEDEKGHLQLKIVEEDTSKDVDSLKLSVAEKDEIIAAKSDAVNELSLRLRESEETVELLRHKLAALSQIQNDQVKSEISCIDFEERYDTLQKENAKQIEALEKTAEKLTNELESLRKEKHELANKLESYMQENMELIDKLEKLSAEKVSSAESIEIVESLTHQEKLEIEAYQKRLDLAGGSIKNSSENLDAQDLNESVTQLNEETAELLQRIELFTVERREVMEKMERLAQENGLLNTKIREIEINRDMLADTYEQLQNEKEQLANKLEELDKTNKELTNCLEKIRNDQNLNNELNETRARLEAVLAERAPHEEELSNFRLIVEQNKTELIASASYINDLQNNLDKQQKQIINYEETVYDLNRQLLQLAQELESSTSKTVDENAQIASELGTLRQILSGNMEELQQNAAIITNLQETLRRKEEQFQEVVAKLKSKYEGLQSKIDTNAESLETIRAPFEVKVQELEARNKEQLEKMKKLAANLKKKSAQLQEIEGIHAELYEKWEHESKEKLETEQQLAATKQQLVCKEEEYSKLDEQLNNTKNNLEALQHLHEQASAELTRLTAENEQWKSVQNGLEQKSNSAEMRIQELEMCVEIQDSELSRYKEKLGKLIEGLDEAEKRRLSLENKAILLGFKLEDRSSAEDELEGRFNALKAHDELVAKQLEESTKEQSELIDRYHSQIDENNLLKNQLISANDKHEQLLTDYERLRPIEAEHAQQHDYIQSLENKLKTMQAGYEERMAELTGFNEKIEVDFQQQLQIAYNERKLLNEQNEKLLDELTLLKQTIEEQRKELSDKEADCQRLDDLTRIAVSELNEKVARMEIDLHESQRANDSLKTKSDEDQRLLTQLQADLERKNENAEPLMEEKTVAETFAQSDSNSVPTFTWPEQPENDPFNFIEAPRADQQEPPVISNVPQSNFGEESNETELLKKVKTLEFVLFNVEKEKDDALLQCHQMSDELTRLIYEKERAADDLESQIVSAAETIFSDENRKELRGVEYQPVVVPQQPISDYAIESSPVVEAPIQRETAYLCFTDNDDGWGASDSSQQSPAVIQEYQTRFEEFGDKIRVLEMERERHLEEIKQGQIKSGKLIKKLKELKNRNEQLSKASKTEKSAGFPDLDDAIQDELRGQISALEKRIKECTTDLERERSEKDQLLKKLDVLGSAKERLMEAKEKQELELISWQNQYRELQRKMEQLEWGSEEGTPEKKNRNESAACVGHVDELNAIVKELTLDNEELQALLEEQRHLRLQAETSREGKSSDELFSQKLEQLAKERDELAENSVSNHEHDSLKTLHQQVCEQFEHMSASYQELFSEHERTKNDYERIKSEYEISKSEYKQHKSEYELLKNEYDLNITEHEQMKAEYELVNSECVQIRSEYERAKSRCAELERVVAELNECLASKAETAADESESLIGQKDLEIQTALSNQLRMEQQLQQLLAEIADKTQEIARLTADNADKDEKYSVTIEELNRQWSERVDERGADVAESWKLHVESRETEFAQTEQQLRKELQELEEKCNALVNENNELRRNVDAEIRNEVDRISALQQQINDRQNDVNELARLLQDKDSLVQTLNQRLKEKEVIVTGIENTVTILQEQIKQQQDVIKNYERDAGNVTTLEATLTESQQIVKQLQEQLREKDAHLEQLREETAMYARDKESQIAEARAHLELLRNETAIYACENETQVAETRAQLERLRDETDTYARDKEAEISALKALLNENAELRSDNANSVRDKEAEISALKSILSDKERELEEQHLSASSAIEENQARIESLRREAQERENALGELESQLDDANRRLANLSEQNLVYERVAQELRAESANCEELRLQLGERAILHDEEAKQLTEMREICEEQAETVEQLKSELYDKSAHYDALVSQIAMSEEEPSASSASALQSEEPPTPNQAELDIALYMLHQRDVRCEELTVELMQLLEERDTLQLRLSNAIKEKEELRRRQDLLDQSSSSTTSVLPTTVVQSQTELVEGDPEVAKEHNNGKDNLANKLYELKTVGYRKDKSLVDEQEYRRMQQLSILQQHKEEVSKLPPEAAQRLVDASYTLSRDVQSPSKVLLNWLWGKSTPKVNEL